MSENPCRSIYYHFYLVLEIYRNARHSFSHLGSEDACIRTLSGLRLGRSRWRSAYGPETRSVAPRQSVRERQINISLGPGVADRVAAQTRRTATGRWKAQTSGTVWAPAVRELVYRRFRVRARMYTPKERISLSADNVVCQLVGRSAGWLCSEAFYSRMGILARDTPV